MNSATLLAKEYGFLVIDKNSALQMVDTKKDLMSSR